VKCPFEDKLENTRLRRINSYTTKIERIPKIGFVYKNKYTTMHRIIAIPKLLCNIFTSGAGSDTWNIKNNINRIITIISKVEISFIDNFTIFDFILFYIC
jgi:hypothetical protein